MECLELIETWNETEFGIISHYINLTAEINYCAKVRIIKRVTKKQKYNVYLIKSVEFKE